MTSLSLNQILAQSGSVLLLDAASAVVHAAWLRPGQPPRWIQTRDEAGRGIFQLIEELGAECVQADAFVFCEGPGSILGIRTSATVIRTWLALRERPVYTYRSLELFARAQATPGDTVICDARRQSWHAVTVGTDGSAHRIARIPTTDLPRGQRLLMPADFRTWSALPDPAPVTADYAPARLSTTLADQPLLRPCDAPDAFLHEDPSYVRWNPAVHRAPEASS